MQFKNIQEGHAQLLILSADRLAELAYINQHKDDNIYKTEALKSNGRTNKHEDFSKLNKHNIN